MKAITVEALTPQTARLEDVPEPDLRDGSVLVEAATVEDILQDHQEEPWQRALRQQGEAEDHDRSLIVERLAWTPAERLAANAAFLQFYLRARPQGPLVRD